eukprot:2671704-Rhodomonas_salina.1
MLLPGQQAQERHQARTEGTGTAILLRASYGMSGTGKTDSGTKTWPFSVLPYAVRAYKITCEASCACTACASTLHRRSETHQVKAARVGSAVCGSESTCSGKSGPDPKPNTSWIKLFFS